MARRISSYKSALEGGGWILPVITCTLEVGLNFATGWVIHRALFGPLGILESVGVASKSHAAAPMNNAMRNDECGIHNKALQNCLEKAGVDISKCKHYLDMLNQCRRGRGASPFAPVKGSLLN